MIDLTEYGFIESVKTDRWIDYVGHDFTVTVYNYYVKTVDAKEVIHHTFVVSSKQFTARTRPITELGQWLNEKKITKTV